MTEDRINEIADNLLAGFNCYIKRGTDEIITIPDVDEFSDTFEFWEDLVKDVEENYQKYIVIEKMDSHESFEVMEKFVETLDNNDLKERIITALERPKPFRNFKFEIDNSGPFRQKWFDFQKEQIVVYVKDQLERDKFSSNEET